MIKVRIPATSANIGPGFDSLGIALNLYNYIELEECDGYEIISADGTDIPTGEDNLVFYSALRLYQECGRTIRGFRIREESNIPLARGLGSSSACIAGGLTGANYLLGNPMTKDQLLDLALDIEGHPDNVAPAIMGGLTISAIEEKKVKYTRFNIPDELVFAAFIPPFELKTEDARKVLPQQLSLSDAVYNLSRSALMATSLASGKYENLICASKDKIHQPNRIPLIPGAEKLMNRVLGYGALMSYISGSGSTIMAVYKGKRETIDYSASVLIEDGEFKGWTYKLLTCDNLGAVVEKEV